MKSLLINGWELKVRLLILDPLRSTKLSECLRLWKVPWMRLSCKNHIRGIFFYDIS
jgi:hypothetical protein